MAEDDGGKSSDTDQNSGNLGFFTTREAMKSLLGKCFDVIIGQY